MRVVGAIPHTRLRSATMDNMRSRPRSARAWSVSRDVKDGEGPMVDQTGQTAATGVNAERITWVRRADTPPFSPAPGSKLQPVIGEKMMTCWITMAPNAVVAEHSHINEQLGVVAEGRSPSPPAANRARSRWAMPTSCHRTCRTARWRGRKGALLVETFAPVRDDYAQAWRAWLAAERALRRADALSAAPRSGTIRVECGKPRTVPWPPARRPQKMRFSRSMTSQMPAPMSGEEVRRRFVDVLHRARSPRGAVVVARAAQRSDRAADDRRHAADDALLPGAGAAARAAHLSRSRNAFAPSTSTRSATRATAPSSSCSATSRSATTSSRSRWPGPGSS